MFLSLVLTGKSYKMGYLDQECLWISDVVVEFLTEKILLALL